MAASPRPAVGPAAEPLAPWFGEDAREGAVRATAFEYTSRGDRVPGRLLRPAGGAGPFPLVLAAHGAGGAKDAPSMDTVFRPWAERGAAVALVDLPLHGARASAKLTARWLATLDPAHAADAEEVRLHVDLEAQARADLHRALDALAGHPAVEAGRAAFAGFSLGALVGARFCADEPRIAAAVLALAGAGVGPEALDPARHVGRLAPRPVLFVNARDDAVFPRERAEALHAAAGAAGQVLWAEGTHGTLPGSALKAMWRFLAEPLGIA